VTSKCEFAVEDKAQISPGFLEEEQGATNGG